MQEFWEALSVLEKILYCIAVPATLVLLIQTVLLLIGFGHGGDGIETSDTSGIDGLDNGDFDIPDNDLDVLSDGSNPLDFGTLRLFTLQGIVAFFCVFGWSGIILIKNGLSTLFSILIAFALGFFFMLLIALLIRALSRLTDSGNISIRSTLGRSGTVYLTIPAKGMGHGKINLVISDKFCEYDAISESETPLLTGTRVRVIDIRGDILLVEQET